MPTLGKASDSGTRNWIKNPVLCQWRRAICSASKFTMPIFYVISTFEMNSNTWQNYTQCLEAQILASENPHGTQDTVCISTSDSACQQDFRCWILGPHDIIQKMPKCSVTNCQKLKTWYSKTWYVRVRVLI